MEYDGNGNVNKNAERFNRCPKETIGKFTRKRRINRNNIVNKWFNSELREGMEEVSII